MDQLWVYLRLTTQLVFLTGVAVLCLAVCRWSARTWKPLGVVIAFGVLVRAWAGLALYAISSFDLPILSGLHTGDGFWHLAPDARVYYYAASYSAATGAVPAGTPSPRFAEVLGLWMWGAGDGLASPVLFNLVVHLALCALIVAAFRPLTDPLVRRAALVTVSAFSFSPLLVLVSTQTLKDVFFAFLIVCATVAISELMASSERRRARPAWLLPLAVGMAAVFLIAGVRPYYGLFVWGAASAALAVQLFVLPRQTLAWGLARAALAVVLLWCTFMWGAGEYYPHYANVLSRTVGIQLPFASSGRAARAPVEGEGFEAAVSSVRHLRRAFVQSGGTTNLAGEDRDGDGEAFMVGMAAIFVPISVLSALSLVQFGGGRGFVLVTDLDTLFIALALAAVVWVLAGSRRSWRGMAPFLTFGVSLGIVSTVLLGYIVTNYGTLFRLRALAVLPFWLLPLAVAYARARRSGQGLEAGPARAADLAAEAVTSRGAA